MASSMFKVGDRVRYVGGSRAWQGGEAVVTGFVGGGIVVDLTNVPPALVGMYARHLTHLGFSSTDWEKFGGLFDV